MKPQFIVAGIGLMLVSIVGGVVAMMSQGGGSATYDAMNGPEIYGKLCQQCHGARGTAPKGLANSYAGKRQYWDEPSLLAYIANPRAVKAKMPHLRDSPKYMPAISKAVPVDARRKLAQHVLSLMDELAARD